MPVTTRAASSRLQANGSLIHSQDQATSTPASTVKTTRKCSSRRKNKSSQAQSVISSAECETNLPPQQQQLTNLDPGSEIICRSDQKDLVSTKVDATVGSLFANRSSTPPHFNRGTRIHQQKNE